MKKKVLSCLLALSMVASLVACGNEAAPTESKAPETSKEEAKPSEPAAAPEEVGESVVLDNGLDIGWVKPAETIKISVYAGEGDQEEFLADEKGGKAVMDAWLLENMNVEFDWQYMTGDMTERLNLMLASGDYPAVITNMSDDMANKFIAQGKAVDLTPYIDQLPNLTRRMGNYVNMLKDEDGNLYKLATLWGDNPNVAGYDFGVRYDYWLELGEEKMYETPQEYIEVMKKILANHPTNESGQKTYAFTSDNDGQSFLNAMLAAYGFVSGYKVGADGTMAHWLNTEEGLEIAKLVNQMYREELIDPDFQSVDYETYISKQSSGQVLGNFGTWWYAWVSGHQTWAVNEGDSYDINKRFANVSCHGEGVAMDETSLLTSNFLGSYRMIITDKATDEEVAAIVKYLNWEASEVGTFIMGFGAPSEANVWDVAADGTWLFDDAIMDVDLKDTTYHAVKDANATAYWLAINAQWLRDDEYGDFTQIDPRVDRVSVYDYWPVDPETGAFSNEGVNICWGYYTAPSRDISMFATSFDANDPITTTKQIITDTINTAWTEIIMAESEEDCVAIFETTRDNCNVMGLEELTAYYAASYDKNVAKFEGK